MQVLIRELGLQPYQKVWENMKVFTDHRSDDQPDEIWVTEHPSVYTLGLNSQKEHLLNTGNIPVIQTDRGGQVTYHGPGQLMIYTLVNIKRLGLNIRQLVTALEQCVVQAAAQYAINAQSKAEAPGVYVKQAKLASVGLRVRKHCSYHGLAVNIAMDTQPFEGINPCGFNGLKITQFQDLDGPRSLQEATPIILTHLCHLLGYTATKHGPTELLLKNGFE